MEESLIQYRSASWSCLGENSHPYEVGSVRVCRVALGQSEVSFLQRELDRAKADEEEAILFLASIVPEESRKKIQNEIENDTRFAAKHHFSLGLTVRNTLRTGGFQYTPNTLDTIWPSWLKKAVNLPKDTIILTDSIKARIKKYEDQQRLENPPICPELEAGQVSKIIRQLEVHYRIKMPEIRIDYSDHIKSSFVFDPPSYNLNELEYVREEIERDLRLRGLEEDKLKRIDWSRYSIFLLRKQPKQYAGLYGSAWHELAHVAASIIGIKDRVLGESFAIANEFRGLLQASKEGLFPQDEVTDVIEHLAECTKYERVNTEFFSKLSRMGIRGIPDDYKTPYHYSALDAIREHNPDLRFRNRSPDELITELDGTIEHVLETWRKRKLKSKLPLIVVPSVVIGGFIIFIIIVSLFP